MRTKRFFLNIAIIVIVLFFLFPRMAAEFLINWWWYKEIENLAYLIKSIELKSLIFLGAFLILFLPSFLTIFISRKLAPMRIRVQEGNIVEFPEHLIRPYLFPLLYFASAGIALLASLQAASNWFIFLPVFSHPLFHIADPVLGRDVSFYAFYLPILEFFYQVGMTSFIMAFLLAVVSYSIQRALAFGHPRIRMAPVTSVHLSVLLGCLALIKAFGYWIGSYDLLLSQDGAVFGMGYTAFHAILPMLRIITVIACVAAFFFFLNVKWQNWKPVIGICVLWGLLSIGLVLYPRVVQQFQVVPSELDKERVFLKNMIAFTRKAYDLENVDVREVHPSSLLSYGDFQRYHSTLQNIRLWNRTPLLSSLAQLQEIRPYYKFAGADVDRYAIDNSLREVMVSARELDSGHLQNPTWINEHLIFTHGYGFVCSPVNTVTPEGLPDFFVKNIPPAGVPEMTVKQPALYYGESTNDYCIVNTGQEEFDYPAGDSNKYAHYAGTGGVALSSFWRRLVFAYVFSYKLFFSSDINRNSRVLYFRDIGERLQKAFPLLVYDSDPYPVIDHGKIYWICDAYTMNDHFPYSQFVDFHENTCNYIRNSVKVVIDAYNGTTTYYATDPEDPILQMYEAIFPGFFHSFSQMPEGLRQHVRVPEDFFMTQASIYALYHMTDPDVFYNREDLWQFPKSAESESGEIHSYYVVMQLPGSATPEFLAMLPFTPSKKDNLSAWFAARCDGSHYGQRLVFQFSKEKLVFGPSQVEAKINQDQRFSQLRTLWGQQGSQLTLGQLQVIPVGNTMLYVEPVYLQSEQRALPELKLVLLSYGDRIVMEQNLDKAFASLFGTKQESAASQGFASPAGPSFSGTQSGKIAEALSHYQKAMDDQRNGDWAGYGKEIETVGKILETLTRH